MSRSSEAALPALHAGPAEPSPASRSRRLAMLWGVVALGACLRLHLLWLHLGEGIVDADEAVVGIMAKHIREGRDFPFIWYGQSYMGTLPSWLSALGFALFGLDASVVRAIPILLSALLVYSVYRLGLALHDETTALVGALWIALPPAFLAVFSLKQANYMAVLVLGCWILLGTLRVVDAADRGAVPARRLAWLGFLIGLAVWLHFLAACFVVPAVACLIWRSRRAWPLRSWLAFGAGALPGIAPLLWHNLLHRADSLGFARAAFVEPAGGGPFEAASRIYNLLVVALPVLLGGRALWSVERIAYSWGLPDQVQALVRFALGSATAAGIAWLAGSRLISRVVAGGKHAGVDPRRHAPARLALAVALIGGCAALVAVRAAAVPFAELPWSGAAGGGASSLASVKAELAHPGLLVYLLYLPAVAWALRDARRSDAPVGTWLLLATLLLTLLLFVSTRFGAFRSPRYVMGCYVPVPILFATLARRLGGRSRALMGGLVAGVLVLHATDLAQVPARIHVQPIHYVSWADLDASRLVPSSNRRLVEYLGRSDIHHVYAKYWLAWPVIFDSEEAILASTGSPGRYPAYDEAVSLAPSVAYLFPTGSFDSASFARLLVTSGITGDWARVSVYDVYSGLSRDLRSDPELWPQVVKLLSLP